MSISLTRLVSTSTLSTFNSATMTNYDNWFVRFWRRVYNPLGFKKGYNFPLCKSLAPLLFLTATDNPSRYIR